MGVFRIEIQAVGSHGCNRKAKVGDKLYGRCMRFDCPDCLTFDFMQMLRQKGWVVREGTFTHHYGAVRPEDVVVDDMLNNERRSGSF